MSLIEVLVGVIITGILFGVVSGGFSTFNRSVTSLIRLGVFSESYLIFLMRFEVEYQMADAFTDSEKAQVNQLIFRFDDNLDGDAEDSAESIQYRWNENLNRIDRKSGNGYYQALLEGVTGFEWQQITLDPFCHRMKVSDAFSGKSRIIRFCK